MTHLFENPIITKKKNFFSSIFYFNFEDLLKDTILKNAIWFSTVTEGHSIFFFYGEKVGS